MKFLQLNNIFRLSHMEKALLITLVIEVFLIVLLFNLGFKEKPKEVQYAVDFVPDDFNFEDLKEEKVEIPEIDKYLSKKYYTNTPSNELQEEESSEEYQKNDIESELQKFQEAQKNQEKVNISKEKPKEKKKKDNLKRFKGRSNIKYYIKNRSHMHLANPIYTCPDYMSGLVMISVKVDQNGRVVEAKFNKSGSTNQSECLIDAAISAARKSFFNSSSAAPKIQNGYITYNF